MLPRRPHLPLATTFALGLTGCLAVCLASCSETPTDHTHPMDDVLRLNHLQCEGTHNSYHQRPAFFGPDWDYSHASLYDQLDQQGVRKFELDVHWRPATNDYAVYHLTRFDDVSSCDTFVDCLTEVRRWSRTHQGHHTIFIQVEDKELPAVDAPEHAAALDALDAEILSVFDQGEVILPDEVQGSRATLQEAILNDGWPTLGETRGRILFFFNCARERCISYANEGAGLAGRVIFADSEEGDSWSAVRIQNTPNADARAAVEAGYIVRTFADGIADLLADGSNDLEAALSSGAHILSTDVPAPRDDLSYSVEIPGGTPSRCNPVTAPPGCTSLDIEDPSRLR